MTGKEAIIEKILSDARIMANSTLEEAGKRGLEIIGEAKCDAQIFREKNMAESYAERDEIIRRSVTSANLEVKKLLLKTKQDEVNAAFEEAKKVVKADKKGYLKLLSAMLSCAEDGDKVIFSALDKDIVDEKWLTDAAKKLKKKLDFGGYGDFCGGIILSGEGSDKNMTIEVELKTVREEHEPEIAGILFGDK